MTSVTILHLTEGIQQWAAAVLRLRVKYTQLKLSHTTHDVM